MLMRLRMHHRVLFDCIGVCVCRWSIASSPATSLFIVIQQTLTCEHLLL